MDQPRLAHGCGEVREPIPMENAGAKESACEKNEPPISSTASLVGGPPSAGGSWTAVQRKKRFIPKGRALALDFEASAKAHNRSLALLRNA
jgi:hypothetical protein